MTKKEKLNHLQDLVIDTYIKELESGGIHPRDFASIVSLLNQNSIVEEKSSSSIEDETKQRVKAANERRAKKNG